MESKLKLYNRVMSTREELKEDFVAKASADIEKRVLLMEEFRTSLRVGLYAAFKNEVRTEKIFREADKRRKELYYPAVDPDSNMFAYFRIIMHEDLRPTPEGLIESSIKQSRLRDINTLNVLIVPGVVFDLHGGRMGYGRGFYDKSLTQFRGKRIALAYDFQVVSELPTGVRGQKVDWIVTEERLIRC